MEITLEENGTNGRYVHVFDNGSEAELNFQLRHNVMIINHVGVPTQHRNHGLAAKLVKKSDRRCKGKTVKSSTCLSLCRGSVSPPSRMV